MEKMEVKITGKVKIVWLLRSRAIGHDKDEGNIVRGYIEFDDALMNDGKSYKKYSIKHPSFCGRKINKNKPFKLPLWIGELAEVIQKEIYWE